MSWFQRLASNGIAFCLLAVLALVTGCAGLPLKNVLPRTVDVHQKKEERRASLIKDYEEKRCLALFQSAQSRLRQGDDSGCQQALEQLLEIAPQHAQGRLLMAELRLMRFELLEAQGEIEQVLAHEPENPQALHAMGLVQEALGNDKSAAEYFGRAAELDPENPLVTLDYETSMDPNYSQAGVTPENLDPTKPATAAGNSASHATHEQKWSVDWEQATTNPRTVAMLRRATSALSEGNPDATLAELRKAMKLEPENIRIPQQAALEAIRTNHSDLASDILTDAVEQFPQSAELYRLYGLAHYRQQRYSAAEQALRKAISLDNRDALAYFLLGQVLLRLGQNDQSEHFFLEACRLDPSLAARR